MSPPVKPRPAAQAHPTLDLDHFLPYRLSVLSNRISSAIAREYCRHVSNPKSVLCIAPSNRERIEINEAVRAMLREAGHIGCLLYTSPSPRD